MNKHHLDAGLTITNKWDLDVENPETKGANLEKYENLPFGLPGSRS